MPSSDPPARGGAHGPPARAHLNRRVLRHLFNAAWPSWHRTPRRARSAPLPAAPNAERNVRQPWTQAWLKQHGLEGLEPALAKLSPNTTLAQLKTLTPDDLEVRQRCPGGPGCAGLSQCRPTLPAGAGCHGRPDRCAVAGLPSGCEAGCALVLTASPPPPVAGAGREGVRQQAARHHHRRFDGACAPARA